MTKPTIGFLGTGLMGLPMAQRLQAAGCDLKVWNRTRDKAIILETKSCKVVNTPAEAALDADIVCLCLTDQEAVETVVFGPDGLIQSLRDNAILVDFSTIGVDATLRFSEQLREASYGHWVDAPVSGGVPGATNGTLTIFLGGDDQLAPKLKPVLNAVGRNINWMGPVGSGQAAKLCNQLIVSSNLVAISEAISLAKGLGMDASRLPAAFKGGFADSLPLHIRICW